jgi:hypothetical protein
MSEERRLTDAMRRLFMVTTALVVVIAVQLFVLTEQTESYFAWTIAGPLSAAWLGAGYCSGIALLWPASRERLWSRARIAVPAVLALTLAMVVTTFIHLDLFHLDGPLGAATLAAYGWIASYILVPAAIILLLPRQLRAAGHTESRGPPLPSWMRLVLATQTAVLLTIAVALLVTPERAASMWPWALTPLTGRAIGAWLLGTGVVVAQWNWENSIDRMRIPALSSSVFVLLQFVALARYPVEVDWDTLQAWVYVIFLASMALTGVGGALISHRHVQ